MQGFDFHRETTAGPGSPEKLEDGNALGGNPPTLILNPIQTRP